MTDPEDIDLRRLLFEIKKAIEQDKIIEMVEADLSIRFGETEHTILDRHGNEVGVIPVYRLRRVDAALLADAIARMLALLPVDQRDQVDASVVNGNFEVLDEPEDDFIVVVPGHGLPVLTLRRHLVVAGWPAPDA